MVKLDLGPITRPKTEDKYLTIDMAYDFFSLVEKRVEPYPIRF